VQPQRHPVAPFDDRGRVATMGDSAGENLDYVRGLVEHLPERVPPPRRKRRGRGMRWRRHRRLEPPFRLKEIYHFEGAFPESSFYKECKLCMDANELAERCPEGSTEDKAGERLLLFFHARRGVCRILWLSNTRFPLCSEGDTGRNRFPFLTSPLWGCNFETDWGRRYELTLCSLVAADSEFDSSNSNTNNNNTNDTPQVLRALHRVVALGTHISETRISLARGLFASGIEDFLSRIGSRRTAWLNFSASPETARAAAFNCSRYVTLAIMMSRWREQDRGAALAEAMAADQCPKCLELYALDEGDVECVVPPSRRSMGVSGFVRLPRTETSRHY
jgi:hypothetical protein